MRAVSTVALRLAWARAVRRSDQLTPSHKLALLALADYSDWPAGINARPGVARLAEDCGLGERAVRYALERGEALGLIARSAPANPKRHLSAVYSLVLTPVSSGTSVPVEGDSSGTGMPVESDSSGTGMPVENDFNWHESDFYRHNATFQAAQNDVSSGTGVPLTKPVPNQEHQTNTPDCDFRRKSPNAGTIAFDPGIESNPDSGASAQWQTPAPLPVHLCRRCDANGWVIDFSDDPLRRCDHAPTEVAR